MQISISPTHHVANIELELQRKNDRSMVEISISFSDYRLCRVSTICIDQQQAIKVDLRVTSGHETSEVC